MPLYDYIASFADTCPRWSVTRISADAALTSTFGGAKLIRFQVYTDEDRLGTIVA